MPPGFDRANQHHIRRDQHKHGFDGTRPLGVPDTVLNQINGANVAELRARGLIAPKGMQNIRGGAYLFSGRFMFGAANVLGLLDGLLLDYDVYRRAQENGCSWGEQFNKDNENNQYIVTPFGVIPNVHYNPQA